MDETGQPGPQALPVLVACAHGTCDPAGRRVIDQLRSDVAWQRPDLEVVAAYVDVQAPALPDVVARLATAGRRMVLVPLLLSAGYHVRVDLARAAEAASGLAVVAGALGPDPALVDLLEARLAACGAGPTDAVVLAAAGSSDPRATGDVERVAAQLAARRGQPVPPAYLSAARPAVVDAVAAARAAAAGRPVAVATYLLAPGFFADRLGAVGADRVTAPLAPDPRLAELVLRRYDAARL